MNLADSRALDHLLFPVDRRIIPGVRLASDESGIWPSERPFTTGTWPTAAAWSISPAGTCRCSTRRIIEEHKAVRTAAGLFDISHMGRLSFGGPDALALIQHVYTNNAATHEGLQVRYGLVCNEQGGIRDDVLVYRWPYGWAMVVNASNRDQDRRLAGPSTRAAATSRSSTRP